MGIDRSIVDDYRDACSHPIPNVRAAHSVIVDGTPAYWFEMNHPGEGVRSLRENFINFLEHNRWRHLIPRGCTAIDVGAHSGDTTIPIQLMARGTVVAVEPNPTIRPVLEFACSMNRHLGKFVVASEAVTEDDFQKVSILDHGNGNLNGGIIDQAWSRELQEKFKAIARQEYTVDGLRLQTLCEKYLNHDEMARIRFVKIDCEGYDYKILRSSAQFLNSLRPVIFIEWFQHFTHVETRDLFAAVESINYVPYRPDSLVLADRGTWSPDLILIHRDNLLLLTRE